MSGEIVQIKFDRKSEPGALAPGVRPGVDGWYWCKRSGFSAPECVYVVAPYSRAAADDGKVYSISRGEQPFLTSSYNADDVKWFGLIVPPQPKGFW